MHATIVNGNRIAHKIFKRLVKKVSLLAPKPHLAVVLVGDDKPSLTYVRKKQEAALRTGIKFALYHFPKSSSTGFLVRKLRGIQKQKLSGIIVQLPLPSGIERRQVLNAIKPELDVDFLSWEALGKLVIHENVLIPPTPAAILEILDYYHVPLSGKHIVMVGQGELIGKPLSNILIQLPITLTVCGKDTRNLGKYTREADILITGVGRKNLIKASMVKKGAVVIDAGVSFEGKKISGDVDFVQVSRKASLITPTPGGVGPVTVAKLLENVVKNAKISN